jgi:hypothetical protein
MKLGKSPRDYGSVWFDCGCEKSCCELQDVKKLLRVVRCKKAESCLVENCCKTIWGYEMIKFWNNVFTS